MKHILALDQGTTSSRAILFRADGTIAAIAQQEFTQHYPQPGWVEHDPEEIWQSQIAVAEQALAEAKLAPTELASIGITNQRETVVVWDRKTGEAIHPAIVWQDRRTSDYCKKLKDDGLEATFTAKTGLLLDPYFSGTKMRWILDRVAGSRERAEKGELACGTIDSWLLWKLTQGAVHATDVSNASRTLLFNIHQLNWDTELLETLSIPTAILPTVKSSSEIYGTATVLKGFEKTPIAAMAGDQQAALFGQCCFNPGMAKNTYGTGCFLLMNTGEKAVTSKHKLLTTVAWKIGSTVHYALEGSVFVGGAVVQWLRDELGIIQRASETEALAQSLSNNGGVYLVPAFTGLGAPHWEPEARGTLVGLTRGSGRAHFARAALESIAYQSKDLLTAINQDAGIALQELRVDGGASLNNFLMQFQADLLQTPVIRSQIAETTALGAAYLAGLATGVWSSQEEISKQWQAAQQFSPQVDLTESQKLENKWQKAVTHTLRVSRDLAAEE